MELWDERSISSMCLRAAFALAYPKSQKAAWFDCLFALLGSLCVKAAHKMMVKLTRGAIVTTTTTSPTTAFTIMPTSSQRSRSSRSRSRRVALTSWSSSPTIDWKKSRFANHDFSSSLVKRSRLLRWLRRPKEKSRGFATLSF